MTFSAEKGTEVLSGQKCIERALGMGLNAKSGLDFCSSGEGPANCINFEPYKNGLIDLKQRRIKVRYITEITSDNINYAKQLLDLVELRHMQGIRSNFLVTESEYLVIPLQQSRPQMDVAIYSTLGAMIEQNQFIFEQLWNSSMPAEIRINEIEKGTERAKIEVIENVMESIGKAKEKMSLLRKEGLIFFANAQVLKVSIDSGLWASTATALENGAEMRLLVPEDEMLQGILAELQKQIPKLNIRIAEKNLQTKMTIFVADQKELFIWELRDETKKKYYEVNGTCTYTNSKSLASSYATIFENLWMEKELKEQLKDQERMQREFVNVAAHELRTPVLPIILSAEGLAEEVGTDNSKIEIILRNAQRLKKLTNDILDVSRIEARTLHISKESIDFVDMIEKAIEDASVKINGLRDYAEERLQLHLESDLPREKRRIMADRIRVNQVVSNLIDNAINFTDSGKIRIILSHSVVSSEELIVSVVDTGKGIDNSIKEKLFGKFVTKSDSRGTGLGLYISKSIIEAHGGRMWAENNDNGIGAKFSFTLPFRN